MANSRKFRYKHLSSSVENSVPNSGQLLDGEIAVNTFAGNEKLFLKNSSGNIVEFKPISDIDSIRASAATQSDWNASSGVAQILNKPTIPTVNDATITITINGTTAGTFTVNASQNVTVDLGTVGLPTVTSADNGKVLMVVNGAWTLVNLSTLYTGTGIPSNNQGNDGDIYLQITT